MAKDVLMETRREQSEDVHVEFNQGICDSATRLIEDRVLLIGGKTPVGYELPKPPRDAVDQSMAKGYLREVSYSQAEFIRFIMGTEPKSG